MPCSVDVPLSQSVSGKDGGVDMGERKGRGTLGGIEGGETAGTMNCIREE